MVSILFEQVPVFRNMTDISVVYSNYSWIFDSIIIATVLGMLFRELFKKAGLTEKLGGIVGVAAGFITVVWIHAQGNSLLMLGPWIILFLSALFGVFIYKIVPGQNKLIKTALGVLAGIFTAGLLLGAKGYPGGLGNTIFMATSLAYILLWTALIAIAAGGLVGATRGAAEGVRSGEGWLKKF